MDKLTLMQGVANKLYATEEAIDAALADASALLTEMVEARKAANVSATVDVKANAKVVEAMAALSAARTAMVEAHEEMNTVKLRLGVRTKMFGPTKPLGDASQHAEVRMLDRTA